MDRTGKFFIGFIILAVVCCIVRIDYVHTTKIKKELGNDYKIFLDSYHSNIFRWVNTIESNELSYNTINEMSTTMSNYQNLDDILPDSLMEFKLCISVIQNNIISKLIENKSDIKSAQNKILIKQLDDSLNELYKILSTIDDNCNQDPLKYYKELSNRDSKTSEKLCRSFLDLDTKIRSINK